MEEKGMIRDARLFYVQELLSSYHNKIKPGIYELRSDMTAREMLAVMSAEATEGETESSESGGQEPSEEEEASEETPEGEEAEPGEEGLEPEGGEAGAE